MKAALLSIGVRALRTFLQSVIMFTPVAAFVAAGAAGDEIAKILPKDFVSQLWLAVQLSLAPTVGSVLHNTLEQVAKYEGKLKG